jgi:hypothetical protein
MNRCRAPRRLNALSVAKMMVAMIDDAHSAAELAELSGLSKFTARHYVMTLHREGGCHIEHWQTDAQGRYCTPAYTLGRGKDAKRPRVSKEETNRRYRTKQAQREVMFALAAVPLKLAA